MTGNLTRSTSGELIRIQPALVPSIESQAMRFFLYNFVLTDTKYRKGHLEYLLNWELTQSKTVSAAITALGMASLSNIRRDTSLMVNARRNYALALRRINEYLRDPVEVMADRTLAAVGLLGLFEVG